MFVITLFLLILSSKSFIITPSTSISSIKLYARTPLIDDYELLRGGIVRGKVKGHPM